MKVPREFEAKVIAYLEASKQASEARACVLQWLKENTAAGGVYVGELYLVDEPSGFAQGAGEYCFYLSSDEFYESGYLGVYYHPIENSTKYLAYRYSC